MGRSLWLPPPGRQDKGHPIEVREPNLFFHAPDDPSEFLGGCNPHPRQERQRVVGLEHEVFAPFLARPAEVLHRIQTAKRLVALKARTAQERLELVDDSKVPAIRGTRVIRPGAGAQITLPEVLVRRGVREPHLAYTVNCIQALRQRANARTGPCRMGTAGESLSPRDGSTVSERSCFSGGFPGTKRPLEGRATSTDV